MSDGLHEISQAIGRLQAEAETTQRQRADLFSKVDGLREDMHAKFQEIRTLLIPLAIMPKHMADHCEELKALNDKVQQGRGVIWTLRVLGAVVVVAIPAGIWMLNAYQADVNHKVRQIERRLPGDFMGRQ